MGEELQSRLSGWQSSELVSGDFVTSAVDTQVRKCSRVLELASRLAADGERLEGLLFVEGSEFSLQSIDLRGEMEVSGGMKEERAS